MNNLRFSLTSVLKIPRGRLLRVVRMPFVYRNWWTAYRNRFGLWTGSSVVYYDLRPKGRLKLAEGLHDVRVVNEIWVDRCYEPTEEFRPQAGWTILDLGANKGVFTVRVACLCPDARVVAVEPDPTNSLALRDNLTVNDLRNVEVESVAVSSMSGEAVLNIADNVWPGTHSLVSTHKDTWRGAVNVSMRSLEELVSRIGGNVDLVKMDIEGSEHDVILNSPRSTLKSLRRIVMEVHEIQGEGIELATHRIRTRLEECGFICTVPSDQPLLFAVQEATE